MEKETTENKKTKVITISDISSDNLLNVLIMAMSMESMIRLRYVDYTENQWTPPRKVVSKLVDEITHDQSICQIEVIHNPKYL